VAHRVATRAESDLDDIWLYVAMESGSLEVASRLVDSITDRFCFLAGSRTQADPAIAISARDYGAFPWVSM